MAKVSIFVGSMYGNAENLAEQVLKVMIEQGHNATIQAVPQLKQLAESDALLFICSTTGQGDIPDGLFPLFLQMQSQKPSLENKPTGIIALGDKSYGETYCGAGRQIEALLKELKTKPLLPLLDIDACEFFDPWEKAEQWATQWSSLVKE